MKSSNRDLLVLVKEDFDSDHAMESTLQQLNEMLYHVETNENFCLANEIIDINKYKIFNDPTKMLRLVKQENLKPFVFVCNKN